MSQLIRNDLSLHYEVSAGPGKPWLFFSHSLGADLSMWQPQLDACSRHLSVLRCDTRGHGKSSVPPGPYTVAQLGQDILALADHVGAARFHFCGLSMGGLIGQWLALNARGRLNRLVLSNTAAKIGTHAGWEERIGGVHSSGLAAIVDTGMQRWFTPRLFARSPQTIDHFRSVLLRTDPAGYIANCAAIRDADFRPQLNAIAAPTLVVFATHDPVTTAADAQLLAGSIPGAQLVELDAAHLSNIEQADAFNEAVLDFLLSGPA
jgi:3-oxoadipate enol-lactonase